jgi:VWFA-related protein
MRRLLVGLSIAGLLSIQVGAQQPAKQDPGPADSPGEIPNFVVPVKAVQAPVTVLDRDGSVVNNLNVLDFKLFDNGKEQKITQDFATHPLSLVVVVQANSAVEKIIPQVQKIGSVFDNLIGENGELALVAFDHRIQTITGFTTDPDKVHDAFKKLKPGSSTAKLTDATMEGINLLRNRPLDRKRVMIIISEDRDNGSGMHVRDVMDAQEFANVVIYSVNMSHLITSLTKPADANRPDPIPPGGTWLPAGTIMTPTLQIQQGQDGNWVPMFTEIFKAVKGIFIQNPLTVFTRYSGGRQYSFMTQRGLEQAVAKIGDDLHSQYLLTYVPDNQEEAGFHALRVEVEKPDLKVYTRDGYWLAGKAAQ